MKENLNRLLALAKDYQKDVRIEVELRAGRLLVAVKKEDIIVKDDFNPYNPSLIALVNQMITKVCQVYRKQQGRQEIADLIRKINEVGRGVRKMNIEMLLKQDLLNEDSIIFPDFDRAVIGARNQRVIYGYDLMVIQLQEDNPDWTEEDAVEWIDYNTIRTAEYLEATGALAPIIDFGDEEEGGDV